MSSQLRPEDEPFSHESVLHHSRSGSSMGLLDHSAGPSTTDLDTGHDGFYDNQGYSKSTLYDPEKPDAQYRDEQDEYSRGPKYENLGT